MAIAAIRLTGVRGVHNERAEAMNIPEAKAEIGRIMQQLLDDTWDIAAEAEARGYARGVEDAARVIENRRRYWAKDPWPQHQHWADAAKILGEAVGNLLKRVK